jgi:PAS domain S-box-containing protein
VLVVLLVAGAIAIYLFVSREQQRTLREWEIRLGLLADSRAEAVERWLAGRYRPLEELANNASLQLYLSQLLAAAHQEEAVPSPESAQLAYLRNLITATAQRAGFLDGAPDVAANLPAGRHRGIALLDSKGRLITGTRLLPPLGAAHRDAARQAVQRGQRQLVDLYVSEDDVPLLGFAVPVSIVQGASPAGSAGVLLALEPAADGLYPLLLGPRLLGDQDETLLLRREDGDVRYLSPLLEGSPLKRRLPLSTAGLAGSQALTETGQFLVARDYRGRRVLATSRPIPDTPWVLVQKTDAAAALADSRQRGRFLLVTFSLLLILGATALVAAWRHGRGMEAQRQADILRQQAAQLRDQARLLHGITDHIDAYTALLDAEGQVVFANRPFAATLGLLPADLAGRTLRRLLGPETAAPLERLIEAARRDERLQSATPSLRITDTSRTYQARLLPMAAVEELPARFLLVLHDITELKQAEERRAQQLRSLVATLMHVVDLHDPHSGHHTERLVEVANAVGETLGLSPPDAQVLDMAASLANLGKIFVPREILTKVDPLTEAEQDLVRRHVQYGVDILSDLEFEGPVLLTIAQKQEHLDGSGYPKGLQGEEILLTARILAVANAFVALVSARAYRRGLSVEQALDRLMAEADRTFDRRVVAALYHTAENRRDWSIWQETDV